MKRKEGGYKRRGRTGLTTYKCVMNTRALSGRKENWGRRTGELPVGGQACKSGEQGSGPSSLSVACSPVMARCVGLEDN